MLLLSPPCLPSMVLGIRPYLQMVVHLDRGDRMDQRKLLRRLTDLQYTRNDMELRRATYRVRGMSDIYPAESGAMQSESIV